MFGAPNNESHVPGAGAYDAGSPVEAALRTLEDR
jgi:hypothetical protein